jgi:hypothetical protein
MAKQKELLDRFDKESPEKQDAIILAVREAREAEKMTDDIRRLELIVDPETRDEAIKQYERDASGQLIVPGLE